MSEKTITIVRVKGPGAGVASMVEMPESTYNEMTKNAAVPGGSKDILDYKVVPNKNAPQEVIPEVKVKTEEEILAEAEEALNKEEEGLELIEDTEEEQEKQNVWFDEVKASAKDKGLSKKDVGKIKWEDVKGSYELGLDAEQAAELLIAK